MADLALLCAHRKMQHALCAYAVVLPVLAGLALWCSSLPSCVAMFAVALAFLPVVEYLLHRYALHPLIYLDSRFTARVWIRIHYAHHDQPGMSDVILASPASLCTIIAVVCIPIALIKPALTFSGAFGVMSAFLFYEIVHFLCHLPNPLATRYFEKRRRLHMLHHFHNEKHNYGICFSIFDKWIGTHAASASAAPRSATVRNLGYDEAKIQEKPLVRLEYERRFSRR
jgi:sterol desaturase/sphingolipid hydroxylase (fatty acid hydroxylase superfamily)